MFVSKFFKKNNTLRLRPRRSGTRSTGSRWAGRGSPSSPSFCTRAAGARCACAPRTPSTPPSSTPTTWVRTATSNNWPKVCHLLKIFINYKLWISNKKNDRLYSKKLSALYSLNILFNFTYINKNTVIKRFNVEIFTVCVSKEHIAGKEFVRFHKNRALLAKFLIFCIVLGMIMSI